MDKKSNVPYGIPTNDPKDPQHETALRSLHTYLAEANNELTSVLNDIQFKINKLSKGDIETVSSEKEGAPSQYNGMLYEFECQKNIAYLNLSKAKNIIKELDEII